MSNKYFSVFIACALLAALAGCGYHLRGSAQWPQWLDSVAILAADNQQALATELREALARKKVTVVDRPADARATLHILDENINRRVASLTSTGAAQEYELHYVLHFTLADATGRELLANQSIELRRVYGTSSAQALAKSDEEEQLREDMRRSAVQLLLMRISAGARQEQGSDETQH